MQISDELKQLIAILNEWVSPAPNFRIYLFGSRARGDHRSDSDVDVIIPVPDCPDEADVKWWMAENEDDFRRINTKLSGKLQILENDDPLAKEFIQLPAFYRHGQVACVWSPSKLNNQST
jgi:hypothetical protein